MDKIRDRRRIIIVVILVISIGSALVIGLRSKKSSETSSNSAISSQNDSTSGSENQKEKVGKTFLHANYFIDYFDTYKIFESSGKEVNEALLDQNKEVDLYFGREKNKWEFRIKEIKFDENTNPTTEQIQSKIDSVANTSDKVPSKRDIQYLNGYKFLQTSYTKDKKVSFGYGIVVGDRYVIFYTQNPENKLNSLLSTFDTSTEKYTSFNTEELYNIAIKAVGASNEYSSYDASSFIKVGKILNANKVHAVIAVKDEPTKISPGKWDPNGKLFVLEKAGNEWKRVYESKILQYTELSNTELKEMNGDGKVDILIPQKVSGTGNIGFHLWLNKLGTEPNFVEIPSFANHTQPSFNQKTGVVSAYMKGSSAGTEYTYHELKWNGDSLVLMKEVKQALTTVNKAEKLHVTILENKNGQMTKTLDETRGLSEPYYPDLDKFK